MIREVSNKKDYMNLLLLADPDIKMINKYINKCRMFVLFENDIAICQACVVEVDKDICELKNISTLPKYRKKGYSKTMFQFLFDEYRVKYKSMIVGTTENMIPYYVLNGFTNYYKTIKNFFTDNYSEEVWDGNLHCIDMYYYQKIF